MIGPSFMDEIDCGSFFDHIDDLLDFPADDATNGLTLAGKDCEAFPDIWQNTSEGFPGCNSVFSGNSSSDLSAELSVPYEDMVQLEWLSNFVEDSFSGGCAAFEKENSPLSNKESTHLAFQTSSPVSVLESSSSCNSRGKVLPSSPDCNLVARSKPGRARSKRPRPAAFCPRPPFQLLSPASSVGETPQLAITPKMPSEAENFAESHPLKKIPKPAKTDQKKKKKIKLSVPLSNADINKMPVTQSIRKCQHCEITKTPQWRAGPMGPKTLCNACGVRYKSGRLFPEYRPAASPTFVPSLHSNSHKKVLEMRTRVGETFPMAKPGAAVLVNATDMMAAAAAAAVPAPVDAAPVATAKAEPESVANIIAQADTV